MRASATTAHTSSPFPCPLRGLLVPLLSEARVLTATNRAPVHLASKTGQWRSQKKDKCRVDIRKGQEDPGDGHLRCVYQDCAR